MEENLFVASWNVVRAQRYSDWLRSGWMTSMKITSTFAQEDARTNERYRMNDHEANR
jgi:hypothetical protein